MTHVTFGRSARRCAVVFALAALAASAPSLAQSGERMRQRSGGDQMRPSGQGSRSGQMNRTDRGQMSRNNGAAQRPAPRYRVDPEGWVRTAYDFDGDGRYDAVEYVFAYDLERARASSRGRMNGGGMSAQQGGGQGRQQQRGQSPQRLSGEITDLFTLDLAGMREPHLCAKIETESGRIAKVDLGPKSKLEAISLQEGDNVKVVGTRGTINGRQMVMAQQISADGETHRIDRPRDGDLRRLTGEVISSQTVTIKDREHLRAKLRLDNGQTTTVYLGPKEELTGLNLTEGEEISVLGKRGRIGGAQAVLAQQVRAEGRVFGIDAPQYTPQGQGGSSNTTGSSPSSTSPTAKPKKQ